MLTKILTKDFKGISFEQDLGQYNLLLGPNGAGKSARTEALAIAIIGYNPKDAQKRPGDIFHTHASGDSWTVGIEIMRDGLPQKFSRTFKNGGTVAQVVACNGKKLTQKQVEATLVRLGEPKLFDLGAFMDLSDQKQINYLFDLFPPQEDLGAIDEKIAELTMRDSKLRDKLKGIKSVIERLTAERSEIQVTGTLAEIKAEVERKVKDLEEAEKNLKEVEAQEREKAAKEEAEKKAEADKAKAVKKAKEEGEKAGKEAAQKAEKKETQASEPIKVTGRGTSEPVRSPGILEDLDSLLVTLKKAGCEFCSAKIQVKALKLKYRGKEA